MNQRSHQARKNAARRRLTIESLENRSVLAGNVAVAFLGSSMSITGDNLANNITITPDAAIPGRFTIAGVGTTVNGSPAGQLFQSAGDLRILLNSGDDTVTINGPVGAVDRVLGSLTIDGGIGNDTINVSNYATGRDLVVNGGTGTDSVTLTGNTVGANLVVNGGTGGTAGTPQRVTVNGTTSVGLDLRVSNADGTNSIVLGQAGSPLTVTRGVSVINTSANPADTSTVTIDNAAIGTPLNRGGVTISNRQSGTVVISPTAAVTTAGNVTISNGANAAGANAVSLGNGTTIGGTLSVANGNSTTNLINATNSTVTGTVTLRNGTSTGGNTIVLSGLTSGSLNANNANAGATNVLSLSNSTVNGDLNVLQGAANANVAIVGPAGMPVVVTRRANITNGPAAAGNTVTITDFSVNGGSLTINNGAGPAFVSIGVGVEALTSVNGPINILNAGGGASTNTIVDNVTATIGGLTIQNGLTAPAGSHTVTVGTGGAATLAGGLSVTNGNAATTTTTVGEATIGGNVYIRAIGASADAVSLLGTAAGGLTINGTTSIFTNDGIDTVNLGTVATQAVAFNGYLTVNTGAGDDTVNVGADAGGAALAVDGAFIFDGAAGLNTINITLALFNTYTVAIYSKISNFVILVN